MKTKKMNTIFKNKHVNIIKVLKNFYNIISAEKISLNGKNISQNPKKKKQ